MIKMSEDNSRIDCLICSTELIYRTSTGTFNCSLCGRLFESEVCCQQGHFVCDACHASSANDLIEMICAQSQALNPVELAIDLMRSPAIKMHGPEHHYLVPAVLLTVYYNKTNQNDEKERKLRVARQRAENVLGGFCGFYGACGIYVFGRVSVAPER